MLEAQIRRAVVNAIPDWGNGVGRVAMLGSGVGGVVARVALDRPIAEELGAFSVVVKLSAGDVDLAVEGAMLELVRERGELRTPRVHAATRDCLVMEELDASGIPGRASEQAAARALARLHAERSINPDGSPIYGIDVDNTIGSLPQSNARASRWPEFMAEQRLTPMLEHAARASGINRALAARVERLIARLGEFLPDQPPASLIHGDVWSGNVLVARDGSVGFIDPSPYYGHAEIELAFITLFGTFGRSFFQEYERWSGSGIDPDFWRTRRDVYVVYPLLVHCAQFGGTYASQLSGVLDRLND